MQAWGSIVLETFNFREAWKIDDLFAVKKQVRHIKKKVGDSHVQKQAFIKYVNVKLIISHIKDHLKISIYIFSIKIKKRNMSMQIAFCRDILMSNTTCM